MHSSIRPARALARAAALFLLLSVTTGWATPPPVAPPAPIDLPAPAAEAAAAGRESRSLETVATGFSSTIQYAEHQRQGQRTPPLPAVPVAAADRATTLPATGTYAGTKRFWIPSLDVEERVRSYPCPWTEEPGDHMYRWKCAGTNNVYILGHNYGVMKPLHRAYKDGTLKVGMVAVYANAKGVVTKFKVTEWRVVDPTDAAWAIAGQLEKSMTLQTCTGKYSQWRLVVRLVAAA